MGMKKIIGLVSALLLSTTAVSAAVPAQANDEYVVAIIDSYFSPSIEGTHLCVADRGCNVTPTNTSAPVFSHGSRMAQIVKKHNPNAKLVLIRAGSVPSGTTLTDANAREISNALLKVPSEADVVSISIYSNGSGTGNGTNCRPSNSTRTGTVAVSTELARATKAVSDLINSGKSIVAAAGNGSTGFPSPFVKDMAMNYPACLSGVTAVTVTGLVGTKNPNLDVLLNPNGNYLGGDINTTSGATAYIASKFTQYYPLISSGNKLVGVLP